jgi:lipopolysaccharide/colanic/teichoic acid biosynthesis glycosyltransferase
MSDEATSTRTIMNVGSASPLSGRHRSSVVDLPRRRSVKEGRVARHAQQEIAARTRPSEAWSAEVLPREYFLAQLHREMRRTDRSKAPLSLAIYRVGESKANIDACRLQELIAGNKRETDVLGQLEDGVLAVICPDTDERGIYRFVTKIKQRATGIRYSAESAMYPHDLFRSIAAQPARGCSESAWLIAGTQRPARGTYPLKRPLDLVGSIVALLLLSPLIVATALAVKLSSPGPIIFRQTRLGKAGVPFTFYKFRSMVVNGDDRIHRNYVANLIKGKNEEVNQQDAATPLYKIKIDPRVTRVGRFIRKTSLDELPQLFNVLRGDMSLVGPRPPLRYETENYESWHLRRVLDIQPGITGLWQVEGRSKVTFDEMVRLDLQYIRGCSLTLDLEILFKTVKVVLTGDGAT